jgi:CDP-diacylglycerol---glycerol-3-phosphate 3-phosphatidyltransferase
VIGDWLLAIAALLTLWSGLQYLHAAWPILRADESRLLTVREMQVKFRGSTRE